MSDSEPDVATSKTSNQSAARSEVAPPPPASEPRVRDPWLRIHTEGDGTLPFAGQPGHGRTASLRRQPVRIVDGRMEGGYTNTFELICPACGDQPDLDYSQVSPRMQWLRGPRTLQAGIAAYEKHLGLGPGRARPAALAQVLVLRRLAWRRRSRKKRSVDTGTRRCCTQAWPSSCRNDVVYPPGGQCGRLHPCGGEQFEDRHAPEGAAELRPGRSALLIWPRWQQPRAVIAAWRAFVQAHPGASRLCGIGEPVDPGRSPAELAECQLHEALLNIAFDVHRRSGCCAPMILKRWPPT